MSLQGVYPLDNHKRKQWATRYDRESDLRKVAKTSSRADNGFQGIDLEPQRMRTFKITYNKPVDAQ